MVEVVEEARKPVPGPAVDNLVKEALRVASMAGGHISTTMLQTTPADLKRWVGEEKDKVAYRLERSSSYKIEGYPAEFNKLDKNEVFKELEEARKEGATQLDISSALSKLAHLIKQEMIRVRLEAKEEDLNRRNPKRAAEKAAKEARTKK
jgi:hypothetical protein